MLGELEPDTGPPREVGVMLLVNAPDQATATAIAKVANPLMLHLPTPDMAYLPSLAFATSPAETERGAAYEFVLNHAVDVEPPVSLFRIARDTAGYDVVADPGFLNAAVIAGRYGVAADTVQMFRIPGLNVVKISFPRPVVQGSLHDRDIHAGQHHVPLALLPLPPA